jgi:hypothetical protein
MLHGQRQLLAHSCIAVILRVTPATNSTAWRDSTLSRPPRQRSLTWAANIAATQAGSPATVTGAPPSRSIGGRSGTHLPVGWVRHPAPLPEWLAADLARTDHVPSAQAPQLAPQQGKRAPRRRSPRTASRILEPLLLQVTARAAVPEGASFTEKLNRAAYTAGGLVQSGHLAESEARTLLEAATHARPHQERRSLMIIDSALSAGTQRPLHP